MMKKCELCKEPANMYCESDDASLCWECDKEVHSANFLVEKHTRILLCHICKCHTAWTASGPKLGKTISICETCVTLKQQREYNRVMDLHANDTDNDNGNESEDIEGSDETSDDDEFSENDESEVEEEQVVPGIFGPVASSSSTDEVTSGFCCEKRLRDDDPSCDDDFGCSNTDQDITSFSARDSGGIEIDSLDRVKRLRTHSDKIYTQDIGTSPVVDSLTKLYEHDVTSAGNAKALIAQIREMSRSKSNVGCKPVHSLAN